MQFYRMLRDFLNGLWRGRARVAPAPPLERRLSHHSTISVDEGEAQRRVSVHADPAIGLRNESPETIESEADPELRARTVTHIPGRKPNFKTASEARAPTQANTYRKNALAPIAEDHEEGERSCPPRTQKAPNVTQDSSLTSTNMSTRSLTL